MGHESDPLVFYMEGDESSVELIDVEEPTTPSRVIDLSVDMEEYQKPPEIVDLCSPRPPGPSVGFSNATATNLVHGGEFVLDPHRTSTIQLKKELWRILNSIQDSHEYGIYLSDGAFKDPRRQSIDSYWNEIEHLSAARCSFVSGRS